MSLWDFYRLDLTKDFVQVNDFSPFCDILPLNKSRSEINGVDSCWWRLTEKEEEPGLNEGEFDPMLKTNVNNRRTDAGRKVQDFGFNYVVFPQVV